MPSDKPSSPPWILEIQPEGAIAPLRVSLQDTLVLGRFVPDDPAPVDVDLGPYGAVENGVSRRHLSISVQGQQLAVMDLNSPNGTRLEDARLAPNRHYLFESGMTLVLGRLSMEVRVISSPFLISEGGGKLRMTQEVRAVIGDLLNDPSLHRDDLVAAVRRLLAEGTSSLAKKTTGTFKATAPGLSLVEGVEEQTVAFIVPGSQEVSVSVTISRMLSLGRDIGIGPNAAHLNLEPYGAVEFGVSRTHARIYSKADGFYIEDLGSRNGTFLNDERLAAFQRCKIKSGDNILLGRLRLYVYLEEVLQEIATGIIEEEHR